MASAATGATFVRRDLDAGAWRTLALAGLRYTFAAGPDARLETHPLINGAALSYDGGVAATPIPLTVSLVPAACVFAFVFLSGVAMLAAVLPARRAARLSIPDALGHAG